MYERSSFGGGGARFGLAGDYPKDVLALIGILFATEVLGLLTDGLAWHWLALTPAAWQKGWVWQIATHTFVGMAQPDIWFFVTLFILFSFGRTAYYNLGRRFFWRLLLVAGAGGGAIAVLVDLAFSLAGHPLPSFALYRGQYTVMVILITAFAVLHRSGTILFMFVLPMEARIFLWIEVAMLIVGVAVTKDLAGFVGLLSTMGITFAALQPGGLRRGLRQRWLALQSAWLKWKIDRMRARRGFHVVSQDQHPDQERDRKPRGPWVN